jgi:hypothetical protein
MGFPSFSAGEVLTAADMNAVGLWLVKTQTIGSAVSSVEVTSAFSSTYDNYLITINGGVASTANVLRLQLGATTSGYFYNLIFSTYSASVFAEGSTTAANWTGVGRGLDTGLQMFAHLYNPNRPTFTNMTAPRVTGSEAGTVFGLLPNSTQYTSFTISPSSGTLTGGTIRVYGYRS